MKPNPEQEKLIEQLLRRVLKFKDTYDEVYDHVLSALDALPDDVHFVDALDGIIEYDFGGAKGLKNIESKHTRRAIRQFIRDYLKTLLVPLTSVVLLFLFAGTGLFYFLIAVGWLNVRWVQLVFAFINLSVFGIAIYRFKQHVKSFQAGRQVYWGYVRQTIIAFSATFILFFPFFLWHTTYIIYQLKHGQVPPLVCAIVFFVIALHSFAGYKMVTRPIIVNI